MYLIDYDKKTENYINYFLGLKINKEYDYDNILVQSVDFFYKDINHYDICIIKKAEKLSQEMEREVDEILIKHRKSFDKFLAKRGLENHMGYLVRKDFKYKEAK